MKIAHDPAALAEETAKLNNDISPSEFKHYFRHKNESTESLPSGRHIGHYKAALHDNDIVDLHVAMLNIGLRTGHALD